MATDFIAYLRSLTFKIQPKYVEDKSLSSLYLEKSSREATEVSKENNAISDPDSSSRPSTRAQRLAQSNSGDSKSKNIKANDILNNYQNSIEANRQERNRRRLVNFQQSHGSNSNNIERYFGSSIELSRLEREEKISKIIAGSSPIDPVSRPVVLASLEIPDLSFDSPAFNLAKIKSAIRKIKNEELSADLVGSDYNFSLDYLDDLMGFYHIRNSFLQSLDLGNVVDLEQICRYLNIPADELRNVGTTAALSFINREIYSSIFYMTPLTRYSQSAKNSVKFKETTQQDSDYASQLGNAAGIHVPPTPSEPIIQFTAAVEPEYEPIFAEVNPISWPSVFAAGPEAALTSARPAATGNPLAPSLSVPRFDAIDFRVVSPNTAASARYNLALDLLNAGWNPNLARKAKSPMQMLQSAGRSLRLAQNFRETSIPANYILSQEIPRVNNLLKKQIAMAGYNHGATDSKSLSMPGAYFNFSFVNNAEPAITCLPLEASDFSNINSSNNSVIMPETAIDIVTSPSTAKNTNNFLKTLSEDHESDATVVYDKMRDRAKNLQGFVEKLFTDKRGVDPATGSRTTNAFAPGVNLTASLLKDWALMINDVLVSLELASSNVGSGISSAAHDASELMHIKSKAIASILMLGFCDVDSPNAVQVDNINTRTELIADILAYAVNHPTISSTLATSFDSQIVFSQVKEEFPSVLNIEAFITGIRNAFNSARGASNDQDDNGRLTSAIARSSDDIANRSRQASEYKTAFELAGGDLQGYTVSPNSTTLGKDTPLRNLRNRVQLAIFGKIQGRPTFGETIRTGGILSHVPTAFEFDNNQVAVMSFNSDANVAPIQYDERGNTRAGWADNQSDRFDIGNGASQLELAYGLLGEDSRIPVWSHPNDILDCAAYGLLLHMATFTFKLKTRFNYDPQGEQQTNVRTPGGAQLSDHTISVMYPMLMIGVGQMVLPGMRKTFQDIGLKWNARIHPALEPHNDDRQRILDAQLQIIEELDSGQSRVSDVRNESSGQSPRENARRSALDVIKSINDRVSSINEISTSRENKQLAMDSLSTLQYRLRNMADIIMDSVKDITSDSRFTAAWGVNPVSNNEVERATRANAANMAANQPVSIDLLSGDLSQYFKDAETAIAEQINDPSPANARARSISIRLRNNGSIDAYRSVFNVAQKMIEDDAWIVRTAASLSDYYSSIADASSACKEAAEAMITVDDNEIAVSEFLIQFPSFTPEHIQTLFASISRFNTSGERDDGKKVIDPLTDSGRINFMLSSMMDISRSCDKLMVVGLPAGAMDYLERNPSSFTINEQQTSFSKKEFELELEFYDTMSLIAQRKKFSARFMKDVRAAGRFVPAKGSNDLSKVPTLFTFGEDQISNAISVPADAISFSKYSTAAFNGSLNDIVLKDFVELYYDLDVRPESFSANPEYFDFIKNLKFPINKLESADQESSLFLSSSLLAFDKQKRGIGDFKFIDKGSVSPNGDEVTFLNPLELNVEDNFSLGVYEFCNLFGNLQDNNLARLKFEKGLQFERVLCIPVMKSFGPSFGESQMSLQDRPISIYRNSARVRLLREGEENE